MLQGLARQRPWHSCKFLGVLPHASRVSVRAFSKTGAKHCLPDCIKERVCYPHLATPIR